MSISPASDIVLDVARAADPAKYRAAVERLTKPGQSTGTQGASFSDELSDLDPPPAAPAKPGLEGATEATSGAGMRAKLAAANPLASKKAAQSFEALVLQEFVQLMFPDNAPEVFGQGTAGEIWKSMLAEQIGHQMAKAGGIGIADRLLGDAKPTRANRAGLNISALPLGLDPAK